MIDFEHARLVDDTLHVETDFGIARFRVNENWIDLFEEEEMEHIAIFFLEELLETMGGETFRSFADAPDDNSVVVTSPRTDSEIAESRRSDRYADLVDSLGEENAEKFCEGFSKQLYG